MNHGDGLASGAKKASFTTREGRSMTKEEWDAMFEPEYPKRCDELHPVGDTRCSLPPGHEGSHHNGIAGWWDPRPNTETVKI